MQLLFQLRKLQKKRVSKTSFHLRKQHCKYSQRCTVWEFGNYESIYVTPDLIAKSGEMVLGKKLKSWGYTLRAEERERTNLWAGGGLNLQATKRNDIPPDITHWATSRQIIHSGVGCAVWQSVTVAASSEERELKTGVLSFTRSKDWAQSDPISFPLLRDFSTIELLYLFFFLFS